MPQLENGYTRIADEILEKVAKTKLNGTQLRILLIVWRSTYGWQKKEFELSESYLAKATGIHKQQIKRELKTLINNGIIDVKQQATFTTGRVLAFNKNYISIQVAKKIPPSELDTTTGSVLDTTTGSELDTQNKELNKHINRQYDLAIKMSLDYDYKLIRKEFKGSLISNNAKKKLPSLIEKYGGVQMLEVVKRYNLYVINKRKKEQPNLNYMIESTFWNGRYEDYLDENLEEEMKKTTEPKFVAPWYKGENNG